MARKPGRIDESQVMHFPKAGIDRSMGFGKQPARRVIGDEYSRTTYLGQNVRAFDSTKNRLRGASRPGLSKWMAPRPGGVLWITQLLNTIITSGIDPPGGGMPQQSQSGRVVTLVVVSQGTVYVANAGDTAWTTPTNSTGNTFALNTSGVMMSAPNNQKLWIVDGTNYVVYTPSTNAVTLWTATAGTLPQDEDSNTARLICTWRGRTVLSGLLNDPQNWFMSRVSDPTDFDYAPLSPAPDDPVAGNNSPLGFIGDVVTALVPYNDDILVFGGDHTIYRMTGDPMNGGQIDLISDSIGFAWGEAWCKDPVGNLYFMSNKTGVYRMNAGTGEQPLRISQGIEQLLTEIDTGVNVIRMIWNDRFQGFHLFVTSGLEPTANRHFFFETRTGAWWIDTFTNTDQDPVCCVSFDGNLADDRKVLIGSWDGFVRVVDPDAGDDDGTPIAGLVLIGPVMTPTGDEMMLHEIQPILAEASGDVAWEVLVGNTAEAALASTAVASGTWEGSRNLTDVVRYSGHAIYLRLTSVVRWAMESVRARISTRGNTRRRGY